MKAEAFCKCEVVLFKPVAVLGLSMDLTEEKEWWPRDSKGWHNYYLHSILKWKHDTVEFVSYSESTFTSKHLELKLKTSVSEYAIEKIKWKQEAETGQKLQTFIWQIVYT